MPLRAKTLRDLEGHDSRRAASSQHVGAMRLSGQDRLDMSIGFIGDRVVFVLGLLVADKTQDRLIGAGKLNDINEKRKGIDDEERRPFSSRLKRNHRRIF